GGVDTWTVISFSTLNKGICASLFSVPIVSVRGLVEEGLNFTLSRRTRVGRAGWEAKRRLRVRWRGDDIAVPPSPISTVRQKQRVRAEHNEGQRLRDGRAAGPA